MNGYGGFNSITLNTQLQGEQIEIHTGDIFMNIFQKVSKEKQESFYKLYEVYTKEIEKVIKDEEKRLNEIVKAYMQEKLISIYKDYEEKLKEFK